MGRMKQLQIEREESDRLRQRDATQSERTLNFDSDDYQDVEWYRQQDTEMCTDELNQVLSDAEIADERIGYE